MQEVNWNNKVEGVELSKEGDLAVIQTPDAVSIVWAGSNGSRVEVLIREFVCTAYGLTRSRESLEAASRMFALASRWAEGGGA